MAKRVLPKDKSPVRFRLPALKKNSKDFSKIMAQNKKQSKNKAIAIFEGKHIRRHWDDQKELWYFSVSDVIAVLTKSVDPVAYWRKLKKRLLKEGGNETVTKCHGLIKNYFTVGHTIRNIFIFRLNNP